MPINLPTTLALRKEVQDQAQQLPQKSQPNQDDDQQLQEPSFESDSLK